MGTGKGWNQRENVLACQAFVAASENSCKGNGQKKSKFEESIEEEFRRLVAALQKEDPSFTPGALRTGSSISQRFKGIRKVCLTFHGIVQSVWNANPTGSPSEENVFNASTAVYNGLATIADMYSYFGSSTLKVGKPFLYLNCYQWLQTTHLWKMVVAATEANKNGNKGCEEKGSIEGSSLSGEDTKTPPAVSNSSERRPVGAKRAAAQVKQLAVLERGAAGIEGLADESKKRNDIAVKLLELERKNSRMSLFQMEGTSPAVRSRFLEIEQKRVLQEMEVEQECIEAARKKARTENLQINAGSNDLPGKAKTSVAVSESRIALTETVVDDSDEEIVAGALLTLS